MSVFKFVSFCLNVSFFSDSSMISSDKSLYILLDSFISFCLFISHEIILLFNNFGLHEDKHEIQVLFIKEPSHCLQFVMEHLIHLFCFFSKKYPSLQLIFSCLLFVYYIIYLDYIFN